MKETKHDDRVRNLRGACYPLTPGRAFGNLTAPLGWAS